MFKKSVSLLLVAALMLTVIPVMSIFASAQTATTEEKMLHVTVESIEMGTDILALPLESLTAGVSYTVSFDYHFVSGWLNNSIICCVCGSGSGNGKVVGQNTIRMRTGSDFDTVSEDGFKAEYTFTLSQQEMQDEEQRAYKSFYLGFRIASSPRIISEFYIGNFKIYRTDDSTQTSIFVKKNCDDMSGWVTNYLTKVPAGCQVIDSDLRASLELTAKYEPYDAELFACEKDIIHYGDGNFDNKFDITDLVNAKKRANQGKCVSSLDFDKDKTISSSDINKIRRGLLGAETVEFEESRSHITTADKLTGGADVQAAALKQQITDNADTVSSSTTYYVSEINGNSNNNGKSASAPINLAKLKSMSLSALYNCTVLFNRGETFRLDGYLPRYSYVNYGAYGSGAKPVISGSLRNYGGEGSKNIWSTEDGYLWETTISSADSVGNIVFSDSDGNEYSGFKMETLVDVDDDGDFYFDANSHKLYLYLRQVNPAIYFDSIEISTNNTLFESSSARNLKIENISFKYVAVHAVNLMEPENVTISGCEFHWIGGGSKAGSTTRLGNAIQLWDSAKTCNIKNNYFNQVYDAAITFQGSADNPDSTLFYNKYQNLTIENNLIEYTSMNFEFWDDKNAKMNNISFSNNIMRFSGYGFSGKQRDTYDNQAFFMGWSRTYNEGNVTGFNISNNIIDVAKSNYFRIPGETISLLNLSNNTYYQKAGNPYRTVQNYAKPHPYGKGLASFKEAIVTVDPTANVYWVGPDYDNKNCLTASYYVMSGGTGDGRSAASPASSVASVIASINADRLGKGDIANVYIMQRDDWNDGSNDLTKVTTWAPYSDSAYTVPSYTATMVVQSYDPNETDVKNNLTFCDTISGQQSLRLAGPTVFKNICIVGVRSDNDGIIAGGYDLTYAEGTTFGRANVSSSAWNGTITAMPSLWTAMDRGINRTDWECSAPQTVTIESDTFNGTSDNRAFFITSKASTKATYNEDVTVIFNKSTITPRIVWGNASGGSSTFNKNLNVHIKSAATVTNVNADNDGIMADITVNGGLQMIVNSATEVTGDVSTFENITAEGGKWFITDATGQDGMFNFTSTAGTFTVKEGYTLVATDTQTRTKYLSENGILTIPAGTYTVSEYVPAQTVNYYVKNGGTGDGRTEDTPAPTVASVIATINDDELSAQDTANIFIMQRSDWNDSSSFNVTAWDTYVGLDTETLNSHQAKIVVQPYDSTITTYLALSTSANTTNYQNMLIGGPTEFKNITLLSNGRTSGYYTAIIANGNDLTMGEGVNFAAFNASTWDGNVKSIKALQIVFNHYRATKTYSNSQTVVVENDQYDSENENCSLYPFGKANTSPTYEKDLTLIVNNTSDNVKPTIYWGCNNASGTATINGNLNINIKAANSLTNTKNNGKVVVNGDLQFINSATTTTGDVFGFDNITLNGNVWYIRNTADVAGLLDFTETVGVYTVREGYIVTAVNDDTQEETDSLDGVLTLTAGKYTLNVTKLPETRNYYVKSGETGDGRTESTPAATVESVIASINADKLVAGDTANIFIMQRSDWNDASSFNVTAWAEYTSSPAVKSYQAKLVVQPYDSKTTTYLALSTSTAKANTQNMLIGGPTEFRGLTLLTSDYATSNNGFILAYGNDLTIGEGVKFAKFTSATWDGNVTSVSALQVIATHFRETVTYPESQTIVIETANYASGTDANRSFYPFGKANAKFTYEKDLTVIVNNSGANTRPTIYWGSNSGNNVTTVNGNVNINIKAATGIRNTQNVTNLVIGGGLQMIVNSKTTVTNNPLDFTNITATAGKWYITNETNQGDMLEFTSTAGTFTVKEGYTLVATDTQSGDEYYSEDGILTLPAGRYTVSDFTPPEPVSYYVMSGGTGDGKTADTPAPTVASVIDTINADGLGKKDTANVYIMQRDDWNDGSKDFARITTWAPYSGAAYTVPSYTATMVVQSYDPDETGVKNYLTFCDTINKQQSLRLAGPTVFKNICIVGVRSDNDGIIATGYNLTYAEGTTFGRANVSDSAWNGTITVMPSLWTSMDIGKTGSCTYSAPQTVTIESDTFNGATNNRAFYITSNSKVNATYKEDVTVIFNKSTITPRIVWGNDSGYTSTFNKNLNVHIKSATSVTNINDSRGNIVVDGGLQMIVNSNTAVTGDVSNFDNITATGGKWFITNATGNSDIIEFTKVAGTYKVDESAGTVVAVDGSGNEIFAVNGVLTLGAGNWTLELR